MVVVSVPCASSGRPPRPPPPAPAPSLTTAGAGAGPLPCRVRLADGRMFTGALPAARHRSLQLGLLHTDTAALVELTPGTRRADGRLEVDRRRHPEHYLPGGASGDPRWLQALLAHAERIVAGTYATARPGERPGEEVFVGVGGRQRPSGSRAAVTATRWLWVDVARPDRLGALWAWRAERPCHLLIASGGSGGVHAYWKLAEPLPARWVRPDGVGSEPIERAHGRVIRALGVDETGGPEVADPRCAERSRVMRLAGTINFKSGAWARILEADLALEPYGIDELVGDLPDLPGDRRAAGRRDGDGASADPYKRIPPPEYFQHLAGITVPRG